MTRRRRSQRGTVLVTLMGLLAVVGVSMMYLSSRIMQERRDVGTAHAAAAARYAAESGIEATLADLAAGRSARDWTGGDEAAGRYRVDATVTVKRAPGGRFVVRSLGIAHRRGGSDATYHTITVEALERGNKISVEAWRE